jgi:hypothetical protein
VVKLRQLGVDGIGSNRPDLLADIPLEQPELAHQ